MDLHWRNTQKPARFFVLDARAFSAVMLFIIHARLWTFTLTILIMVIFWVLERRGLTFEAAIRGLRAWVVGARRPALRTSTRRHWIDFG